MKKLSTLLFVLLSTIAFTQNVVPEKTKKSLKLAEHNKLFIEGAAIGTAGTICNFGWLITRQEAKAYPEDSKQWANASITAVSCASAGIFMTSIGALTTIMASVELKQYRRRAKMGVTQNGVGVIIAF